MAHSHLDPGAEDEWPWNCARCGTTIYHDAVHCKSCEQRSPGIRDPVGRTSTALPLLGAWIDWIEEQSYSSLVATSSAIAGIELLLTTLWLRILFYGSLGLPPGVPI